MAPLGLRVLFVDDDPVNRRLGGRMLARLGCSFVMCEDGDEVPAALTDPLPYDVILMDILMQRTNGAAVCADLRAKGIRTPILAMTGGCLALWLRGCVAAGTSVCVVCVILKNLQAVPPSCVPVCVCVVRRHRGHHGRDCLHRPRV